MILHVIAFTKTVHNYVVRTTAKQKNRFFICVLNFKSGHLDVFLELKVNSLDDAIFKLIQIYFTVIAIKKLYGVIKQQFL